MTPETTTTQPAAEVQQPVASGVIDGGWAYIWGAYGVTWALLLGYAVSLVFRAWRARPAAALPGGRP